MRTRQEGSIDEPPQHLARQPPSGRLAARPRAALRRRLQASAQQDPPGRVARLNFHQGTVSFSPAGDDSWYDVAPEPPDHHRRPALDRPQRARRAARRLGRAAAGRPDQRRVVRTRRRHRPRHRACRAACSCACATTWQASASRSTPATSPWWSTAPGEYRIEADPAAGTTRVAVAAGRVHALWRERRIACRWAPASSSRCRAATWQP